MERKKTTYRKVCECGNRIDMIVLGMKNISNTNSRGSCEYCGKITIMNNKV